MTPPKPIPSASPSNCLQLRQERSAREVAEAVVRSPAFHVWRSPPMSEGLMAVGTAEHPAVARR